MSEAREVIEERQCPCGDMLYLSIQPDGQRWWLNILCTPESGCMWPDRTDEEWQATWSAKDGPSDLDPLPEIWGEPNRTVIVKGKLGSIRRGEPLIVDEDGY